MQRVAHVELAFADLHDASAQTGEVIHRRLQSPVVSADDVRRVALTGRVDVDRSVEPVAGLGQQLDDPRGRILVLDEVGAIDAFVERVDDGHVAGVPSLSAR